MFDLQDLHQHPQLLLKSVLVVPCGFIHCSYIQATVAGAPAVPVTPAAARQLLSLVAPQRPVRAGPSLPQVPRARHHGADHNQGYQVLIWGPDRRRTSLSQVMLTAKDVLECARKGLPADLLVGRKQWLGQHAVKCDLLLSVVPRLTAGIVGTIKYVFKHKLKWRVVFLFEGNVILCTPEAYAALDSDPRRRQIYYTHTVLSNQFAALEPAAEWYQDVMLDNFDSDEEASSQADSDSDGSEWEEVPETQQQQQPGPATDGADPPSQQQQPVPRQSQQQRQPLRRRARPNRVPVQPGRGLNVGVINATGLTRNGKKRLELMELLLDSQVDILGVTETHESHERRLPADHIPGYKFYSKPRPGGRGGGVAVAVHACLTNEVKPFLFSAQQYDETIWLVLQRRGQVRKMFIGVVYMPDMSKGASVREAAYTQLQQDLLHLSTQGSVVVMGDFNARVGRAAQPNAHIGMHGESNDDVNGNGNLLLSLLTSVDMYALNARTPPQSPDAHLTYIKHRANGEVMGKSLIDYIITTPDVAMPRNAAAGPSATVGRQLVSSDHMPVLATIQRVIVRRTTCERPKLKLNTTSKDFKCQGGSPAAPLNRILLPCKQWGLHTPPLSPLCSLVMLHHRCLLTPQYNTPMRHWLAPSGRQSMPALGTSKWWLANVCRGGLKSSQTPSRTEPKPLRHSGSQALFRIGTHIRASARQRTSSLQQQNMNTSGNCLQQSPKLTMTGPMMTAY